MSASSDVPKKRFKIRYSDLLIDGIHIECITWRLRFAVQVGEQNRDDKSMTQRQLVKPDDELIDSLSQIGIEAHPVREGLMLEALAELKHGPAGLGLLLDAHLESNRMTEDKGPAPTTVLQKSMVLFTTT
ncbi:hypothetical protein SV7mr_19320 [Stieleria bergensis]|uniref:Uncharacterized protein n=1 Tax=Stieleria bergensis TaxID=2528025 RepID=A0A517STG8_9BACT|nr:hypothetical protein SV7mr_19320 [Planctomycetes bacterium SV_7m_r]